eukprot:CAMPEP_0170468160 /NCGR_PEP_ID=MMETSP0123-20130129/11446_1 /TAXON_ID=182087 /ORGANISM="Favella ehrenbergii, Strain Fehren 1" /LENGTH=127 /DNA_ID=CAMNT_0010734663 /DNA_START=2324 /DNA_END=2707 /DNA_ORIENTATION=+
MPAASQWDSQSRIGTGLRRQPSMGSKSVVVTRPQSRLRAMTPMSKDRSALKPPTVMKRNHLGLPSLEFEAGEDPNRQTTPIAYAQDGKPFSSFEEDLHDASILTQKKASGHKSGRKNKSKQSAKKRR